MEGRVVGNYKILEMIGQGGMGAVFKGVDLLLEREVAIKALQPEVARDPELVERFRNEAITLAKLSHPNIATLHSFFRQDDDLFMVMEFVRGETLESILDQAGALPCDQALSLFAQAIDGIDHAHKLGIVHRDIKPANVMLTEAGSIKIMDFGLARVLGSARMTKHGTVIGTVAYMSPERLQGQETDIRSDVYSLGILLYEMLTGQVPFRSDNEFDLMRALVDDAPRPPRVLAPHIPLAVEEAIMRALAKDASARPQTAGAFGSMVLNKIQPLKSGPSDQRMRSAPSTESEQPTMPLELLSDRITRLSELESSPGTSAHQVKDTRLAASQVASKGTQQPVVLRPDQGRGATSANQYHPDSQTPGTQNWSSRGYSHQEDGHQKQDFASNFPGGHSNHVSGRPLLSQVTWKYYVGAAALLAILSGIPVGLVSFGRKGITHAPPAIESASPPAPPSVPLPDPSTMPAIQNDMLPGALGVAPGSQPALPATDKLSRTSRDNRIDGKGKPSSASPEGIAAAPGTKAAPQATLAPPVMDDKIKPASGQAVSSTPNKAEPAKDKNSNEQRKGSKLGGFFKKLGGALTGGEKNKNVMKP